MARVYTHTIATISVYRIATPFCTTAAAFVVSVSVSVCVYVLSWLYGGAVCVRVCVRSMYTRVYTMRRTAPQSHGQLGHKHSRTRISISPRIRVRVTLSHSPLCSGSLRPVSLCLAHPLASPVSLSLPLRHRLAATATICTQSGRTRCRRWRARSASHHPGFASRRRCRRRSFASFTFTCWLRLLVLLLPGCVDDGGCWWFRACGGGDGGGGDCSVITATGVAPESECDYSAVN